jgi:hypothetical protein
MKITTKHNNAIVPYLPTPVIIRTFFAFVANDKVALHNKTQQLSATSGNNSAKRSQEGH